MNCTSCDKALPGGARFCAYCGSAQAVAAAKEERKLVTVVFCDLVGSTALSGRLDPETLRWVTLRYFAAMREQIEMYGGTVEKFIGDAVMAVFGVPAMHEDDAHRAAAAALGMVDALAVLNQDLAKTHDVRLQVRIGVHTGSAVTSTDVSTRQALVSGETVNIAARLEQNAGAGEVLIGPLTLEAIRPVARTEEVGPLQLKGKQQAVVAHRLLAIGVDVPELLRRFDLPFVGRPEELATLDSALAAGGLVTVLGEPGIGKTRLVHSWLAAGVPHGWGRCRPYGESGTLTPLADALRPVLAATAGADPESLAVLEAHLLLDGTPGPSAEATAAALNRVLAGAGRAVLAIDDCQWAADPLLDLLDRLGGTGVLVVRLARFDLLDRRPAWADGPRTLLLTGLDAEECELMAATLTEVGAHAAPAAVLETTGGNPFYLEQLFAAAAEGADLPPSLQSLIGARIDALPGPERTALDLAAVLGREFGSGHLTEMAGTGPVGDELIRLVGRRLVEPPSRGADVFRFSNGLIHEATYQVMAKRVRAERHERAADVLAGGGGSMATVAGHLEQAYRYRNALGATGPATSVLRARAAALLAAAGGQALTRCDLEWAGDLLGRAVDLFDPGEPGRATALRHLGEVRIATGRAADGHRLLRTALGSSADPAETAHARLALAVLDADPAASTVAAVARAVLPVFVAAGDPLGQARAHIRLAQHEQFEGRHAEAERHLSRGLIQAVRGDAEGERALALGAAGVTLWRGPIPVPVAITRCRELLAEHGAPRPAVRITLGCTLAVLLALDDRPAAASECLDEAGRLIQRLGFAEGAVVLPLFAATILAVAGDLSGALSRLDEGAAMARGVGADGLGATIAREAARILLGLGRPIEAAARLDSIATPLLRADAADANGLRARMAASGESVIEPGGAGRHRADALIGRALAAAAQTDSPIVRATAALDEALVHRALGRADRAVAAAGRARALFAAKGHLPGVRAAADQAGVA